jgi:hypothetical protein
MMRGAIAATLFLLAGALWATTRGRGRCFVTRRHDVERYPLGGLRCKTCGAAFADLDDAGLIDGAYVPCNRRLFSREHMAVTRTSGFDPGKRGF